MNRIRIKPSKLSGYVKIPPSKSMAHRAIICASLSQGVSRISNIDFSDDIIATIEGMRSLGASIEIENDVLIIDGTDFLKNKSQDNRDDKIINENSIKADSIEPRTIDCNESGSTLRFLVPISLVSRNYVKFIGRGNLGKRPLKTYYDIFDKQGIEYSFKDGEMDLTIDGALRGDVFQVKGNISSQFISGLLFTLPLLEKDSKIVITTNLESKGYIDLTLDIIDKFGVVIVNNDYKEFIIKGGQSYKPTDYKVEGDYSQAAFFFSAGALGNNVECLDLNVDSYQGDKECIDILERMGAKLFSKSFDKKTIKEYSKDKVQNVYAIDDENMFEKESIYEKIDISHIEGVEENILSIKGEKLKATVIDASQCPDIIPVLTVVASLSEGETRVVNGERLRIKECDRLNAICTELNKLGANIVELDNGLVINGVKTLEGGTVYSHKDHRIAMSLAIASTMCKEEVILEEPDCVSKSYPAFWEDFKKLGGKIY